MKLLRFFWIVCGLIIALAVNAGEASLALPSGETLGYTRHAARGDELLLWFASERGLAPAEVRAAEELAARGIEVWQIDLVAAFFLPQTHSSLDGIAVADVRAIFDAARKTGKRLSVYAVNRAAVPVLRALAGGSRGRIPVLLMHPHFYANVDTLAGADYLGFGNLEGVDALILQPRRSAATPWANDQAAALRRQGAKVRLLMLDNLRERYWVRETATDYENAEGARLAERIIEWRTRIK